MDNQLHNGSKGHSADHHESGQASDSNPSGTTNGFGGYVYIAVNPAMPKYVKIGKTRSLDGRLKSLYASSVPFPFEYYYAAKVKDPEWVESKLHEAFADRRASSGREFFQVPPQQAASALQLASIEDVTSLAQASNNESSDHQGQDRPRVKRNRDNLDFLMLDIGLGEELVWREDPAITCTVAILQPPKVALNGKVLSLSASATAVKGAKSSLQGSRYWLFQGETLEDRRNRLERDRIQDMFALDS